MLRHELWKKYKAAPVIRLMIVSNGIPSKNFLGTPYKGGYPDLSPVTMSLCKEQEIYNKSKILISLKATTEELFNFLKKDHSDKSMSLRYKTNEYIHQEKTMTESNVTLNELELGNGSIIYKEMTIEEKEELKFGMNIAEEDKLFRSPVKEEEKSSFLILQEEIFEDVSDTDLPDDTCNIIEEGKGADKVNNGNKLLKEEFEQKYKDNNKEMTEKFLTLPITEISKNLENLLE